MVRYYPNGVKAERLIRLDEELDHQVCVEYLLRQENSIKQVREDEKKILTDIQTRLKQQRREEGGDDNDRQVDGESKDEEM